MGLFDKAVSKAVDKKLNNIRETNPYEYDNLITPDRFLALRDRFTRTMLINSTWYGGNDLELKRLYQRDLKAFKIGYDTSDELNYFWATNTEGTNIRKIHSGIPQLISEKFVDLLTANGYEYNVYKDVELIDRDDENQERLETILDDNGFSMLLPEAIETESWSGGVAWKLSYSKVHKQPIIEVIQPEEYEATIKAGRIIEDIFITYYTRGQITYKYKEYYGVDEKGGYIRHKLFKFVANDWLEAPLDELEQTKDLKDTAFPGIFEKFSLYKPNKLPNSEFRGSRMGESDYAGSHGIFDAIDEVLSTMIQEFRDGKIRNFWPYNLLPVDPMTDKQYIPPALQKDFVVYNGGIGEKEQPTKLEMIQGEINSEKYLETYKKLLEQVLNNAGLSPQSVGVTGLESTSASEESQELREKTSIRTREKKLNLWTKALEKLFALVLMLDDIGKGKKPMDYIIKVVFNDYKIQTTKEKTEIASQGLASGSWDIKSAVEYIHDELTEEEQTLMRVNIKIERGINVFTKDEELVYKKFVQEVQEEAPEVNVQELEEVEADVVDETLEEEVIE